jgi:ABC-type sugar transport system permease subunit
MRKSSNNKAWWLVVPVLILVAFNAFIPLMTVVNYSLQETFGNNVFFWEGVTWFEQVHAAQGAMGFGLPGADGTASVNSLERGGRDVEHIRAAGHWAPRVYAELDGL